MARRRLPDLTFPAMPCGTHQTPWDLRILLYKKGAATNRRYVTDKIESGALGSPLINRLQLVVAIHSVIDAKLARGTPPRSIHVLLETIWRFARWADASKSDFTLQGALTTYRAWTEALLFRQRIKKDMSEGQVYREAVAIAQLLARIQDIPYQYRVNSVIRLTRIRAPRNKKRILGAQADKENLEQTFAFGRFLADICDGLDAPSIRGPLPIELPLRDGRKIVLAGYIKNTKLNPDARRKPSARDRLKLSRAALPEDAIIATVSNRSPYLNLRIEAELLIFIAQTSMNLTQARRLRLETYRWQTVGEDLQAYRVYKGRRSGEAIFRCFSEYRKHLQNYLTWLDETGLRKENSRLFPFVHRGSIPAEHSRRQLVSIRGLAAEQGLKFIGPRQLRKTRVNWLLRRSRDLELTAEQAAHSKETLIRHYEVPHHQAAAAEIVRFHIATDPTLSPPGPGFCVDRSKVPSPIRAIAPEAPRPDCVSPEGCLFCIHHRDVLSYDYCWKLASHAKLKAMELSLYRPSKANKIHPACAVIDRINAKLDAIALESDAKARWVRDARDAVRASNFHSVWSGHIHLLEAFA